MKSKRNIDKPSPSAKKAANTVRRSVALPRRLVEEVTAVAGSDLKHNMNRLVIVALQEFVAHRKQEEFAAAMEKMARDPAIANESASIIDEFLTSEMDGLKH